MSHLASDASPPDELPLLSYPRSPAIPLQPMGASAVSSSALYDDGGDHAPLVTRDEHSNAVGTTARSNSGNGESGDGYGDGYGGDDGDDNGLHRGNALSSSDDATMLPAWRRVRWRRWAVIALLCVVGGILLFEAIMFRRRIMEWLLSVLKWVQELPLYVSMPAYFFIYIVLAVCFFPSSILTAAAGFIFSSPPVILALVMMVFAATLAACVSFWIARSLLRSCIEETLFSRFPLLADVNDMISADGVKLVLLIRLCPVLPFAPFNMALGLTHIDFKTFVWTTFVGIIPDYALTVYIGYAARSLSEIVGGESSTGWPEIVFLVLSLVMGVVLVAFLIYYGKNAMKHAMARAEERRLAAAAAAASEEGRATTTTTAAAGEDPADTGIREGGDEQLSGFEGVSLK